MTEAVISDDVLLSADRVRAILGGISDQTLWRLLHRTDDGEPFPAPRYIGGRRYWLRSSVMGWIERRPTDCVPRGTGYRGAA
jgi:predicted DNA-binding transcriptional regulator AlpA